MARPNLCKIRGPGSMVHPTRQMDLNGFLRALGDFFATRTGDLPTALVDLCIGKMTRVVDEITPMAP